MSSAASIEPLIALNREIAALVRAGVPLERGLVRAGEADAAHGPLAQRLASRLSSGESLAAALDAERAHVPSAYRAVVAAGLRSGRLPEALETVASLAESMQSFRRGLALSAVYPLFVVALAYLLFVWFIVQGVPVFAEMSETMRLPESEILDGLLWLRGGVALWGWLLPLAGAALLAGGLVIGRMRSRGWLDLTGGLVRWVPGAGRVVTELRRGWFCQLLAGLLEHGVPLPEALDLSGDAMSDDRIQHASRRLADALRTGESLQSRLPMEREFSPLIRWMIAADDAALPMALRRAAEVQLFRARRLADWLHTVLPVAAVVLIGGGAVLVYCLAIFLPLTSLLHQLTIEPFL